MNANHSHDRCDGPSSERATEIQSPEGLGVSIDLSIPRHVVQHPQAPQVAGYVLTGLLGEGAYGQVWRAWQIRTRKEVAVKVFKQRGGLDWVLLQREVERLMRLDRHPHVVTLLDAGLEADPPYYVIDLLEGGSLQQFVEPASPADPRRAIDWALEVCDALSYVHRKGLIHCDLKPANILIDDEDRVRVVDFGQSRIFTESSAALGTLFYMAPEQAVVTELGSPVHPDVRWDLYALGATLYAVLTGRTPHATAANARDLQDAPSLADRLERYRALLKAGPLEARDPALVTRAGPELAAVVAKCLAPRPEDRYESVAELRADLLALRANRPISPLAHRRGYRLRKFVRRNPLVLALAAAAIVLAVTAGVVRFQRVRIDEQNARHILTCFVGNPDQALEAYHQAGPRVRDLLAENTARYVTSPAFTDRVMGARGALWVNPDAFWASVDGGPLWRFGEWLEVVSVAAVDSESVVGELMTRAADGTDRQKYVAFCLLGQIQPKDSAAADRCAKAAATESHPGVIAAARWAAVRLGRAPPVSDSDAVRVDDFSGLAFVRVIGCESFRRGSPPDEKDRMDNEVMPDGGRPIQSFFLSVTEVTAGAFAPFVNDPEVAAWVASRAESNDELRTRLEVFAQTWQSQLNRGATAEPVGGISLEIARRFCDWLNVRGAAASPTRRYRLPTEDEWEYACRAGNPGRFCFGDNAEYATYFAACNSRQAPAVAHHMPNFNGLFDMHGGLWECTDSRFPTDLVADQTIPDDQKRDLYVLRGGAYYLAAVRCRSAQRNYSTFWMPDTYRGFRIVMEDHR